MHRFLMVVLLVLLAPQLRGQAPVDYRDVGLVINDNDSNSVAIGEYFAQKRGLPARNIIHVRIPATETINDSVFTLLRAQIEQYLTGTRLVDSLNYLVLTKGLPHRVDRGGTGGDLNSKSASVDAELMLILGQWSTHIGQATLIVPPSSVRVHPYFRQNEHYARRKTIPNNSTSYDMFLVTRLTGLTRADVFALIDRSGPFTMVNRDSAQFVLDMDPVPIDATYNNNLPAAAQILQSRGWRVLLNRDSIYVTQQRSVLGYTSWGSNDHFDHHYAQFARPANTWLPGSVAETYVSTSARNFTPGQTAGQSRIADLIAEGCTGASGYVFEPFSVALTWVNTLFDRYTSGYNLAESFYMANPTMSWMAVVVGDPKTSIIAARPPVPAPMIEAPTAVCAGDAPTFIARGALDGTMLWFAGDSNAVKAAGLPPDERHPLWIGRDSLISRVMPVPGSHTISFLNENFVGRGWAQHTVTVAEKLAAGFTTDHDTLYLDEGGRVLCTDTTRGAVTRSWNFGDGTPLSTGATVTHTFDRIGVFTVTLETSNGPCTGRATHVVRVMTGRTGLEHHGALAAAPRILGCTPHPVDGRATITVALPRAGVADLRIFDALGRCVARHTLEQAEPGTSTFVWDAGGAAPGLYRITVSTAAGSAARTLIAR